MHISLTNLVRYGICSISMASVGSMMLTRKKCELAMTFSGSPFGFFQACEQLSIPYALENPSGSYAWEMPQMKRFISHFSPKFAWLDFCQYGEDWKKPTTIMGNFWSISQLSKQCSTLHGLCSRTQRPHFALTGTDENNIFWTLRAQPYPHELCQKVAGVLAKDMAK